ncbi:MAG: type II secretion system F family protein [Microbacterium sp.]|uniref:type II secretion system F family protein n=1 Tax=Microbacterium sp. TaxID=51671 RepID=UPI003A8A2A49
MGRVKRSDAHDAAGLVLRLAVLLQAGVTPGAAWRHLAESDPVAVRVCADVDAGTTVADALRRGEGDGAWAQVGAAWEVATTVGAPLAESLRTVAEALRDAHEAADDVRIALAEPAGTARLMLWLPAVGALLGVALGFDTLTVMFGSVGGIVCLVGGVALILAARRWTGALVRRAQPPGGIPGLHAELTAIALSGGVSIDRATTLVESTGTPAADGTTAVLALSRTAGVPAVELLRAAAAHERQTARTDGRLRAAALGGRLLLPLGVCTLPAFLLLGVAPLMISVLSSTSLPL